MKQEQLLIQRNAVIDGFCYAFTEALLEKLKELKKEGRIENASGSYTDIAVMVVTQLGNQLSYECGSDADNFIDVAEGSYLIYLFTSKLLAPKLISSPILTL